MGLTKKQKLTLLSETVANCTKCPELTSTRTQTVFVDVNPDSKILLLGESPGQSENELGLPFVGQAGKLLNNILASVGLRREDVYICNVLRCRPPNNRKPTPAECHNCSGFLRLQIRAVNPQFIVCLGGVAAQNLLKTSAPISGLRGVWHTYEDGYVKADVLPTWHPAYCLRTPAAKKDVWEDMQKLVSKLEKS